MISIYSSCSNSPELSPECGYEPGNDSTEGANPRAEDHDEAELWPTAGYAARN